MKQFKGFQKGVNLGGWVSQCKPTEEHYDSFISEKDFETIASWKVDHVRLPVDYMLLENEEGTEYKEKGFARLHKAVEWAEKNGLNLLIDLHMTYGFSFYEGFFQKGFFDEPDLQERFYRLWEKIAQEFGNNPEHVAFELLNEVTDKKYSETWNKVMIECISRIRKFAPKTKILTGGYWNNSIDAIPDLPMPYDENIVYNFHCYEPFLFTHQGAGWVKEMPKDFRSAFPVPYETFLEGKKLFPTFTSKMLEDWDKPFIDVDLFEKIFSKAVKIAEERNVALYCGEYGVIENADIQDTLKWYKAINSVFVKYGIGRAAWSYKQMNFGLTDEHYKPVYDEVVKYL